MFPLFRVDFDPLRRPKSTRDKALRKTSLRIHFEKRIVVCISV